jgi:hypothetical protein
MGYFGKIGTVRSSQGGIFLEPNKDGTPGRYRVKIDAVKIITNWNNEDFLVVEMEVLASNVHERPAGTKVSWAQNMRGQMTLQNFKGFLMAAFGQGENEIDEEICNMVTDEETQAAAGKEVEVEAVGILTKKEKKPFTKLVWSQATEQAA